ncbi:MAG: LysR family transcriptional regulator [Sneathiella sp.]
MIKLGFHHLLVIRSIGQTGSVSGTARGIGVTQSAISHRMKEAERRIGMTLFQRDGHRISLTQAGRRLSRSAHTILDEAAMAERDLERMSSGFNVILRIGAACYAGFEWYPKLLNLMSQEYPNVSLEVVSEVSSNPASLLTDNLADFVLSAGPVEQADIRAIPVAQDQLVAVMSPSHRLSNSRMIAPEDFADETYVTHHTLPETGREYESIFKPANIIPKRVISAGRTQAVLELVKAGQAITILPRFSVKSQAGHMGLSIKPISQAGTPITWYILHKKKSSEEKLTFKITDILKKCLQEMV